MLFWKSIVRIQILNLFNLNLVYIICLSHGLIHLYILSILFYQIIYIVHLMYNHLNTFQNPLRSRSSYQLSNVLCIIIRTISCLERNPMKLKRWTRKSLVKLSLCRKSSGLSDACQSPASPCLSMDNPVPGKNWLHTHFIATALEIQCLSYH